jgi:hypothetical protein
MLGKIAGIPDIDVVNRQTKQEGTLASITLAEHSRVVAAADRIAST